MPPHSFNPRSLLLISALGLAGFGSNRVKGVQAQEATKQTGTNSCGRFGESDQDSSCQNIFINAIDDWCLFGPPGKGETVGTFERKSVAWCTKPGHGTRVIPPNTFTGVHFVETDAYVQVTGQGDLTSMHMVHGDTGGELDFSGADGLGNPIGGKSFTKLVGSGTNETEVQHWMSFISSEQFCLRVCKPKAKGAKGPGPNQWCEHQYDTLGCSWNMPGNYGKGFTTCEGDAGTPQGLYVSGKSTSTYARLASPTPSPHPAPSVSQCTTLSELPAVTLAAAAHNGTADKVASDHHAPAATLASGSHGTGSNAATQEDAATGHASNIVTGALAASIAIIFSAAAILAA